MNSLIEMSASDIRRKIDEIDNEIFSLKEEKKELEEAIKLADKWSPTAIAERLREMIIKKFGQQHNIKTAIFKPNSEYNDQGYDYTSPVLILIDSNFNEVEHNLNLNGYIIPDQNDESNYYDAMGNDLFINDITLKF